MKAIIETHHGLRAIDEDFEIRVEDILDGLVAHGDLLELSDVTTLEEDVKGTWLFAAPPAFVMRASGSALLVGLTADDALPLPDEVKERVREQGAARFLDPDGDEDISAYLIDVGLRPLSQESWLRPPKRETADQLIATLDARLAQQNRSGDIEEMRILDDTHEARRYRDRWRPAKSQTGNFIIRRPQAYGADLWAYAELAAGKPVKLVDLPGINSRWRGCDVAWRIQMASDALRNRHQTYRRTEVSDGVRLDFFSPIPDWARRRLSVFGQILEPDGCLLSFLVRTQDADEEEAFLADHLFLKKSTPGEAEH